MIYAYFACLKHSLLKHLLLALLGTSFLFGQNFAHAKPSTTQDDRRLQDQYLLNQSQLQPILAMPNNHITQDDKQTVHLDEKNLQQQPDLLTKALGSALFYYQSQNVLYLLPLYEKLPAQHIDQDMLTWANAVKYSQQGNHRQAIRHYRQLIAKYPQHNIMRLQLAMALFADHQLEASDDQFAKLQSNTTLPDILSQQIDLYRNIIRQQNRWHFAGGITYIQDQNINNAPQNADVGGNWHTDSAKQAQGLSAHISAYKKQHFAHHTFADISLEAGGKYYNLNQYNEVNARLGVGIGQQNAIYQVSIQPFLAKSLYAGGKEAQSNLQPFVQNHGMSVFWQYRPHAQWQTSLRTEYSKARYNQRTHLDGDSYSANGNISYSPNARQSWQLSVDYNKTNTQSDDDSFVRFGTRITWRQEWQKGISTRLSAGIAQRTYQGAMPIFNRVQKNQEYLLQGSIWHRNIHHWGITPRLTWQYHKQNSTIALYNHDKHNIFIELSKQF